MRAVIAATTMMLGGANDGDMAKREASPPAALGRRGLNLAPLPGGGLLFGPNLGDLLLEQFSRPKVPGLDGLACPPLSGAPEVAPPPRRVK